MTDQTEIFRLGEGDNWFHRNDSHLTPTRADPVLEMATRLRSIRSACELGCANGCRLAALRERFPEAERLAGSDISKAAIDAGRARWPSLELAVGSLDDPKIEGAFDLVIVSFVFHWVGRERLARSIAAVDNVVGDGGALIIADFLPDQACARPYHHRSDVELFTYKQDYAACFASLGYYSVIATDIFAHSGAEGPIEPDDRACCTLLRKDLSPHAQPKASES